MAQHIPIQKLPQKRFRKIEEGIRKDFKKGYVKGSLKYRWDKELSDFYKENENEEVYLCDRYIGKGIVYGSERGSFEIHYNKEESVVNNIYLVA